MASIKERWLQFKEWQKQPYQVAPMTYEHHTCATCSTEFQGNFCPRCGQSSKIVPKMSILKTFLLFIDVWGLGNRGMFRTLRDLILRPGYMICDYLRGMHQAYFPPFKLLFLLTTLSLLIGHGWNLAGENYDKNQRKLDDSEKQALVGIEEVVAEDSDTEKTEEEIIEEEEDAMVNTLLRSLVHITDFQVDYPSLFQICFMLLTTAFYFIFFRKSKIIGRFTFQEFFIAMIYISDMVGIYNCIFRFFGFSQILIVMSGLTYIIPLKQMTGYSWVKTIWRYFLTWLIVIFVIVLSILLVSLVFATIIEIRHY